MTTYHYKSVLTTLLVVLALMVSTTMKAQHMQATLSHYTVDNGSKSNESRICFVGICLLFNATQCRWGDSLLRLNNYTEQVIDPNTIMEAVVSSGDRRNRIL
jgi:hypothetical protein